MVRCNIPTLLLLPAVLAQLANGSPHAPHVSGGLTLARVPSTLPIPAQWATTLPGKSCTPPAILLPGSTDDSTHRMAPSASATSPTQQGCARQSPQSQRRSA